MPYKCPNCGEPVRRGTKHSSGVQIAGGLIGALVYACFTAAFGAFQCKRCGEIPMNSFAATDRRKMMVGSLLLVLAGVATVIGGGALLVALNST
jgi:hypothetical protein